MTGIEGMGKRRAASVAKRREEWARAVNSPPAGVAAAPVTLAVLRLAMGWIFLWAFLDKTFGLGFATPRDAAWLGGGSPTEGFLTNAVHGPFADFYRSIAGAPWADALFMAGLLGIGLALMLGIGMRIAAVSGAVMLLLMWSSMLPPTDNPVISYHIVFALVLALLAVANAGDTLGLGRAWSRLGVVRRYPWLR